MPAEPAPRPADASTQPPVLLSYLYALLVVAAATAAGWLVSYGPRIPDPQERPWLANTNVLMLYLLGVLWIATRYSRGAAIFASVVGVAAFDICFVPPYLRLAVHDQQYMVTFAVMLLTALTISTLTHRARAHSAAARAAWERAEHERLRNTLLSGVSHELRTPLAAITGAASALIEARDQLPAESRDEMLSTVYDEAERMERLISNLLEMTRLESGGLIVRPDWVPLQELVGSALHRLDRALLGRDVRISVPEGLPLLYVDGVGIEQVLVNLIENAVQYTPAGSPIEIRARTGAGDVTVEVADHGPGIPAGAETRVFDKFFRDHASRGGHRHGRGIGLGLAICRAIVEAHGGRISVATRSGEGAAAESSGAVFRFTLPQRMAPPVVDVSG